MPNLINQQWCSDKIYSCATGPSEANCQFLINKREILNIIKYSNAMEDIYKNIEEHNPSKEHKILTVFDKYETWYA